MVFSVSILMILVLSWAFWSEVELALVGMKVLTKGV